MADLWQAHLTDTHLLSAYSRAMAALAKGPWSMKQNNRIHWCIDRCNEYFHSGDALQKLLLKDLRRVAHGMISVMCVECVPSSEEGVVKVVQEFRGRSLRLLDVGSCYNPFSAHSQFDVTAVDIAPATEVPSGTDKYILCITFFMPIILSLMLLIPHYIPVILSIGTHNSHELLQNFTENKNAHAIK